MRRFTFLLSVVAVVLLGLFTPGGLRTAAQDATPGAETTLPPVLQQWFAAAEAGDGDALAALYTDDGVYEDVPTNTVLQSHEAIAEFFNQISALQQDVHADVRAVHPTDDGAVLEYTVSGTDLESGKHVSYVGAIIFELEGDAIRRSADYYDVASILAQLGMLPMGQATPTP
jgi:steroid delta-isomerase-like uncharacterized protein